MRALLDNIRPLALIVVGGHDMLSPYELGPKGD